MGTLYVFCWKMRESTRDFFQVLCHYINIMINIAIVRMTWLVFVLSSNLDVVIEVVVIVVFWARVEKNFQTWDRMRGKLSLLEWEMLLEQWGRSRENQLWAGSIVHFYTQGTRSGIRVLRVICWLDKAHILGDVTVKGGNRQSWTPS